MNKNFIKELNRETTYLEFRILTYLECEEKMKIVTHILNFLKHHDFLVNLSIVYYNALRAENIPEHQDVPSLTLDMRDDKFRFKYWDGSKIFWTYHLEDLADVLIQGREDFTALIDKYQPITNILFKNKDENENIKFIRYKYYPMPEVDIEYEIQFFYDVKDTGMADLIMKDIFKQINDLNIDNLAMNIDYSFESKCLPCQKAKEKQNERENMARES